ncbi:hypothetical protein GCM10008959_41730 [Deinococcus seoulensis]|uniref:Uncharacterized protein n=1 Tax=Deinococcus seoulensis TaxID=1837379 RepID=A0ABQ2RXJ1_9DEIO|nr:hypothetical protein GCM10008959_41730 [Deinococcus seoulensis]
MERESAFGTVENDSSEFVSDDVIEGTGYMCTGCAMPVESGPVSDCCGLPVVDSD